MVVERLNWVGIEPPVDPIEASVRIRYKHEESPALIQPDGASCGVKFDHPQRSITPGQAAVFYQNDLVLGGGWIREAVE
jgi:tRNA-specific 2-thiouridylase